MAGSMLNEVHGNLYTLFPSVMNFAYKVWYSSAKNTNVYLDKPPSIFKRLEIGESSSSSGIIRVITFSPSLTEISIGSYTRIGEDCHFMINTRHTPKFVSNHMNNLIYGGQDAGMESLYLSKRQDKNARLWIGSDVWIGTGVKIIGSRKIGHGAILAAGAVVTKDVEPYEVVGGVPAQNIGFRFDKQTRERLLKIAWWNWDKGEIKNSIKDFYDPSAFIKKHR